MPRSGCFVFGCGGILGRASALLAEIQLSFDLKIFGSVLLSSEYQNPIPDRVTGIVVQDGSPHDAVLGHIADKNRVLSFVL